PLSAPQSGAAEGVPSRSQSAAGAAVAALATVATCPSSPGVVVADRAVGDVHVAADEDSAPVPAEQSGAPGRRGAPSAGAGAPEPAVSGLAPVPASSSRPRDVAGDRRSAH